MYVETLQGARKHGVDCDRCLAAMARVDARKLTARQERDRAPGQQPGACSPACVHLMEAATLSARLVEAEERLEKCMVALRACAGLQFGKCPICGHRISQCDKNPVWGDETCGGHLARVALKAIKP